MPSRLVKIAAVQAAPVFLDREATVAKACDLIREAGRAGAALVVFPETYIPAYPDWVWAVPPGQADMLDALYAELLANSIEIPSPATDQLADAARAAGLYVAMGINERNTEASGATLYNTLVYFGPDGHILGKHRKLVPTGGERLVWAQGDGSTLAAYDTAFGKLSGLICWENYMPLARYAVYAWGTEVYVAPTWDRGGNWLATMRHIALEGRLVVVGCCMALHTDHIPDRYEFKAKYYPETGWINQGWSVIVGPNGQFLAGPLKEQEGILYAEVDLSAVRGAKRMLDVAGHYNRPDVFELTIRTDTHPALRTS